MIKRKIVSDNIELSICIPVFNKFNFTKACIDDLKNLPTNHEIIVVDNGSSDQTQAELEKLLNNELNINFTYIRNDINLGFAAACNIAYSVSKGSNVMFLNNDIRVKENHSQWTDQIIKVADNGLIGPTMGQLDNNLNFIQESNNLLGGNSYMSGWCITSSKRIWNLLEIPRSQPVVIHDTVISQIFSEKYGIAYFEDTDLGFRARKLQIPFIMVKIPVVHFGKITSKQLNTNKLYNEARKVFLKEWSK